MDSRHWVPIGSLISILVFCGMLAGQADGPHPECSYFADSRNRLAQGALRGNLSKSQPTHALSSITEQVTSRRRGMAADAGPQPSDHQYQAGSIDFYIFADLAANNITPAPMTTDWEFIRRASLDITGRIPGPDRVLSFVADTAPDKRAKLIDELLAKPEWVDKWTMYFGDLYQNAAIRNSISLNRNGTGRNAFAQWIQDSLAKHKPYNQMAAELISPSGSSGYIDGAVNWLANGVITNGPNQDSMDQMTANVFETFLGIGHMNCLLCHNGHGHLDNISLWGGNTTRYQAWQLASFFSHTRAQQLTGSAFFVLDNVAGFNTDYALNTVIGNRPARQAPQGCGAGQPCQYVAAEYIFTGDAPEPGTNYRAVLAKNVTGDFQFARATVNYVWAHFFGRGIVDPPDGFDPARLDPDNPPPDPWTLQPSNARLLNALARHFIDGGYDLSSLMREITLSDTYQLSSRYDGQWSPAWEPYFARKFVRRLWGEEVHDAIVQSSGSLPVYIAGGFPPGQANYAMQFPEPAGMPSNDAAARSFLDAFLRGNRDDLQRRQDGSILQALSLMNNPFVEARLQAAGAAPNQLITQSLNKSNPDLVNTLFLAILSRYPSADELSTAAALLPTSDGRLQAVQDLIWSLYNKVDFVFNY